MQFEKPSIGLSFFFGHNDPLTSRTRSRNLFVYFSGFSTRIFLVPELFIEYTYFKVLTVQLAIPAHVVGRTRGPYVVVSSCVVKGGGGGEKNKKQFRKKVFVILYKRKSSIQQRCPFTRRIILLSVCTTRVILWYR